LTRRHARRRSTDEQKFFDAKFERFFHRVRPPTPRGQRRPAGTGKQQRRDVSLISGDTNFLEDTGLTVDLFSALYNRVLPALTSPRVTAYGRKKRYIKRWWTPMTRLYMVLRWLRTMDSYRRIAADLGGWAVTVSREIWDTIPKLYTILRDGIRLPTARDSKRLHASGAIDCTHSSTQPCAPVDTLLSVQVTSIWSTRSLTSWQCTFSLTVIRPG
jgi:hypothetical protein